MAANAEKLDCVKVKRRAQEALLAGYRARQNEFSSPAAFLEAKAEESEWVSALWEKLGARTK